MLSKNLYFIHNFDTKMHYSIYYSLLKMKDSDEIHFNDSVQRKKCNHKLGRWNFMVANKDISCGVYNALEIIRQSVFSAMESNKNSVDIALVPTINDADDCYIFNCEQEFKNYIDIEQLKKHKAFPADYKEKCECDTKISKQVFFKVIKPVLEEMFKKTDHKITINILKNKIISERPGQSLINFKRDLDIIRIEWCVDKFFNDSILKQNALEKELQLTA